MMELRNLRYLVALAERLSYARAAEDVGISQSALTRSIQTLEAQLGLRLFDRDRAGVSPTPQGRQMVERARHLLAESDDLERYVALSARGEAGSIAFGMAPMPSRALLPAVLSAHLEAAPEVACEVMVRDVDALWTLLVTNRIEFFVCQDGLLPDAVSARIDALGSFPLSIIVRRGHPLLRDQADPRRFPLIRSSWLGLPLPSDIEPHVRGAATIIEDYAALVEITRRTDAIWFASRFAVAQELVEGTLCELPRPRNTLAHAVRIVMYSLDRRTQSPIALALKDAFRREVRALGASDR